MLCKRLPIHIVLLLVATTLIARADKTDDYIKARMDEFHLPGLSLAVIKDGTIIKSAGYGLADVGKKIPATADTVFKIGSVSKQFIATGIMLLVNEGRLALENPASKFLDGPPPAWKPITIRHLLTHTAGLVRESPAFAPSKVQNDADVIKAAYSVPLRFAPGEKWEYSNLGYFALADIIRKVTGRRWTDYINEKVFKPAGMNMTAPTNVTPTLPNRARGYTGNDNARNADDWRALRPSGAFFSTVRDLAKWEALLYTDLVLGDSARQQMWTPVQLNDGNTAPYGLGWHVDSVKGHRRVWHGGGVPGFSAYFVRYVDDGLTVIALTNGDDSDVGSIANGVAALYLPESAHDTSDPRATAGKPPPTPDRLIRIRSVERRARALHASSDRHAPSPTPTVRP